MKTIHILIGLPGSGKSYFANKYCDNIGNNCVRLDIDNMILNSDPRIKKSRNPFEIVADNLCYGTGTNKRNFYTQGIMADGLFTKLEHIVGVANAIIEGVVYRKSIWFKAGSPEIPAEVVLHYWNEDREHCLENDKLRIERANRSTVSIQNLDYIDLTNEDTVAKLKEEIKALEVEGALIIKNIRIKKHEVYKMDEMSRKIGEMVACLRCPNVKDNKLYSDSWNMGGSYGNCWDDTMSPADGEEPSEFDEFDDMMANLVPSITFIDYKRIKKKCVSMEDYYESDYYGGGCTYGQWVCDLAKLVELCEEYGYEVKK